MPPAKAGSLLFVSKRKKKVLKVPIVVKDKVISTLGK